MIFFSLVNKLCLFLIERLGGRKAFDENASYEENICEFQFFFIRLPYT